MTKYYFYFKVHYLSNDENIIKYYARILLCFFSKLDVDNFSSTFARLRPRLSGMLQMPHVIVITDMQE